MKPDIDPRTLAEECLFEELLDQDEEAQAATLAMFEGAAPLAVARLRARLAMVAFGREVFLEAIG